MKILHSRLLLLLFLLLVVVPGKSYGHLYGLNVQEWTNRGFDTLIQFEPSPVTPSVGKNTTMDFSVQNLDTGEHLKNFTEAVTVVYYDPANPSDNPLYKFNSTRVSDGDFSIPFVFSKGGTYEVFLRVDTVTFINVSRFTVFVSSTQFQIINMVYTLLPFLLVIGAMGGIGYVISRHLYKKGNSKS